MCIRDRSEPSESGSWSLPESFRKFSLGLTQSVTSKSQSADAADSEWLGSKLLARSHSSNMLNESGGSNSADESGGASPADAEAVAMSTPSGSMSCVLNHSHTGPFTPVPSDSKTSSEVESTTLPALSLAAPSRLASKPPLPQRSGTMSPRDTPPRPRLTHRRSQSLQQFTPAAGFMSVMDRSSVRTEQRAADLVAEIDPAPPSETTPDVASTTHEIFV